MMTRCKVLCTFLVIHLFELPRRNLFVFFPVLQAFILTGRQMSLLTQMIDMATAQNQHQAEKQSNAKFSMDIHENKGEFPI
jgi:hypothetical protein